MDGSKMSIGCSFKHCYQTDLDENCARVEAKSVLPKSGVERWKDSLLVSWKPNAEATFHKPCWDTLLQISRKRNKTGATKRRDTTCASGSSTHVSRGGKRRKTEELVMIQSEKVMIKETKDTVEMFDSNEHIKKMACKVATMISKSHNCVFFTGAGISTSAGLGDFRGKGGKWTEMDRETVDMDKIFEEVKTDDGQDCETSQGKRRRKEDTSKENSTVETKSEKSSSSLQENGDDDDEAEINYEDLRPTFTHESMSKLIQLSHVKYLISQNCDGLHVLSGVPQDKISELHGNVFVEKCEKCNKRYQRAYYVCDDVADMYLEELSDSGETDIIAPKFMKKCDRCGLSHRTGRKCEKKHCKGHLMDTIINFGDGLEEQILDRAFDSAAECDLMVCLGSTLMVTPANELVDYVKDPQRIVICNRQPTEKDDLCEKKDTSGSPLGVRVYGDCDVFMQYLMEQLLGKEEYQKFVDGLKTKKLAYDCQRKTGL